MPGSYDDTSRSRIVKLLNNVRIGREQGALSAVERL